MTHGITQFKFLAMACIMFASAATPAMAADLASQVQAHLAVGEFAPAIKLANEAGDRAESDRLLRRVAVAQARSGNHRAALHTFLPKHLIAPYSHDRHQAPVPSPHLALAYPSVTIPPSASAVWVSE